MNMGKSEVMRHTRKEDGGRLNVLLNGESLEEVYQFKNLGSIIVANGGVEADLGHRVNEDVKFWGHFNGLNSMFVTKLFLVLTGQKEHSLHLI